MSDTTKAASVGPKGAMPSWLREEMQRQKRTIAWHKVRSRRTGTGWPEANANGEQPTPATPHPKRRPVAPGGAS